MNKKNIVSILAYVFIGLIVVVAFARLKPNTEKPAASEIYSMNTIIDISIYGQDKEKAMQDVVNEIQKIDKLTDDFSKTSDIYKINENAGVKPVKVNPLTTDLINKAVNISQKTEGSFDPTVYPLSKLWGFKGGNFRIPSTEEITQTLKLVSYKNIKIDKQNNTVFLPLKGEGIDLGGIAKGYTLDKIEKILSTYNISRALINMGGNVLTYKNPPSGKYWRIGIRNPRGEGISGIINVAGTKFISTSGDYERFFIKDGVRYCHIINPFTGRPAEKIVSVTIVSDKGYLGDALSTAFFVQGEKYALKNADRFNVKVVGFNKDLAHFLSKSIESFVTFQK